MNIINSTNVNHSNAFMKVDVPTSSAPRSIANTNANNNANNATSSLTSSNPLRDDPQLRELLKKLDEEQERMTKTQFVQWKAEFLERFELYLPQRGTAVATQAYQRFAQALYHLLRLLKRVEQNLRSGALSSEVGQSTVKGRHCLAEFGAQVAVVSTHLDTLIPGTVEMQDAAGYNKFQMVAVLVRDAFPEYGSLKVLSEIFCYLRQYSLHAVADKIILKELDIYSAKLTKFLDIIADLGLYKAICKYNNGAEEAHDKEQDPVSEPAPKEKKTEQVEPKTRKTKSSKKKKKRSTTKQKAKKEDNMIRTSFHGFDDHEGAPRMLHDPNYDPCKETEMLKWSFHDYYHGDPTEAFLHLSHNSSQSNSMFLDLEDEESGESDDESGHHCDLGHDSFSTTCNSSILDDDDDEEETIVLLINESMHTNTSRHSVWTTNTATPTISIPEEEEEDDDDQNDDDDDDSSSSSDSSNQEEEHHQDDDDNNICSSSTCCIDSSNDDIVWSRPHGGGGGADRRSLRPGLIRGQSIVQRRNNDSNTVKNRRRRGGADRSLRPGMLRGESFDDDDTNDDEEICQHPATTMMSNSDNSAIKSHRGGGADRSLRPGMIRGKSFDDDNNNNEATTTAPLSTSSSSDDRRRPKSRGGGAGRSLRRGDSGDSSLDDIDAVHQWMLSRKW